MSIVKSFSVGDGDMFYIKHGSDNFSIIDCCMSDDDREAMISELKREKKGKQVTRFISTHPDNDHIQGLKYLDDELNILNFYCVKNEATKDDYTDDFDRYCELRDSDKAFYLYAGCSRRWMNMTNDERGSAGISILWPEIENKFYKAALKEAADGKSPNNISPIVKYSLKDSATMLWKGDLDNIFMENIEDYLCLPAIDILFAPHHGCDSGKIPESLLYDMSPKIIIIGEAPAEKLNYYRGYDTITQNTAGDIIFELNSSFVHIYVSSDYYEVDFLEDHFCSDKYGNYIGTFEL